MRAATDGTHRTGWTRLVGGPRPGAVDVLRPGPLPVRATPFDHADRAGGAAVVAVQDDVRGTGGGTQR